MKDFCYNVIMLIASILTVVLFVLAACTIFTLASCRSSSNPKFLSVECVGTNVVITTEVPHLYEGILTIDGILYEHPITLPKEDFAPGPHVVTLTCLHVGPQPDPFYLYQAYGPEFTRTDVFEIEEPVVGPPDIIDEDDSNNGHGDDDDHDDDSNPGRAPHGHKHHGGDDDD